MRGMWCGYLVDPCKKSGRIKRVGAGFREPGFDKFAPLERGAYYLCSVEYFPMASRYRRAGLNCGRVLGEAPAGWLDRAGCEDGMDGWQILINVESRSSKGTRGNPQSCCTLDVIERLELRQFERIFLIYPACTRTAYYRCGLQPLNVTYNVEPTRSQFIQILFLF